MRKTGVFLLIIVAAAVVFSLVGRPASASEGWLTDYNEALAQAKETGRPILADFTGSDWCGWCKKLDREVFQTDTFKDWAADNVVLLVLDFPRRIKQSDELKAQNQGLAKKHGVEGFPTILFLDDVGNAIGRAGYMKGGADVWVASARSIVDAYLYTRRLTLADDLAGALAAGEKDDRPVLVLVTDSDDQASALQAGLLADPRFILLANDRLAVVQVDASDEGLAGLRGNLSAAADSSLLLVSADGKELLHQADSIAGADGLVPQLREALPRLAYDGGWTEDVAQAQRIARDHDRPLLLDFTGSDWCGWCKKLDAEIFSTEQFKDYAKANLVLVAVDFPKAKPQSNAVKARNMQLAQKYRVEGFPTLVVVSADGKELGRTGYAKGGPEPFVENLKATIDGE